MLSLRVLLVYQILLVTLVCPLEHIPQTTQHLNDISRFSSHHHKKVILSGNNSDMVTNGSDSKNVLLLPFEWNYLRMLNGTVKNLANCCIHHKIRKKRLCLTLPLPVCSNQSKSKCSYFNIKHWAFSNQQFVHGCCCDVSDEVKTIKYKVNTSHKVQTAEFYFPLKHGPSGKRCICLAIKHDPCVNGSSWECLKKSSSEVLEIKNHKRKKRSNISNPMIYPNFRHINERKRTVPNANSKFEIKMESGLGSSGMGNRNWSTSTHMSSSFWNDDFRRHRYKRELHVMLTRYSKTKTKRSPLWPWSKSRRSNNYRRPNQRYYSEEDITTTPFTFLNVSFVGYTEVKTTTTEEPKITDLKWTKEDREFVFGKKKEEEPKPKFEAVLGDGHSQYKIRVD